MSGNNGRVDTRQMDVDEENELKTQVHRIRCMQMHKDGKTTAQIAMILKRSGSWVSKWRHQQFENFRAKPRSGRPKILSRTKKYN